MNENPFKPLAGHTFKEGPYEYRIYVKTGEIGDDHIVSISIFLENIPNIVGMDLVDLAIAHVRALTPEDMKTSANFMINKIVMEEYESMGEVSRSLIKGVSLGLQSLDSLTDVIERNMDKKIDFEEINRAISARSRKVNKTISFLNDQIKTVQADNNIYSVQAITGNVSGAPTKNSEGIIKPGINVKITVHIFDKPGQTAVQRMANNDSWKISRDFRETFNHHSIIDLHSYDKFEVDVKKA